MAFVIILTQNISKIDILIKSLKVDYTVQDNLKTHKNYENYKNIGIIFENFDDLPINFEKFISSISKNTKYIDLISCRINENSINRIKTYENKYDKIIRYSTDSIGHKIFEGTWILNSHNISIKTIYFNNNIDNWMNILGDINYNELFIKNVKRYISDLEDKNNEVNNDLSNPVVINHTNTQHSLTVNTDLSNPVVEINENNMSAADEEKREINSKTNLFRTEYTKLQNYLSMSTITTNDIYIEKYNEATETKNTLETLYEEIRNHTQSLSFLNCVKKAWILGQTTYLNIPVGQAYLVIEDGNLVGKSSDEWNSIGYSSSETSVTPRNLESDFMALNKRHRLIQSMVTAVELYEDSKVNSIGKYAFYRTSQIKTRSLIISEHMNKIDNYAFSGATWEIELRIKKQSGEFTIGKRAFEFAQRFYHIGWYAEDTTGDKLKLDIGDYAFVAAGIRDGDIFTDKLLYNFELRKLGIGALSTKIMDYLPKFASSDVSIDNLAFYNSNIPLITIPDYITHINTGTFLDCTKITNLTLENIKILGSRACEGCVNLQTIELNKCEKIGTYAFKNCTRLNKVITPKINIILDYAFQGCDLENMDLKIPRNYTYIYPELMSKLIFDKYDNQDGKFYDFTDYTLQSTIFTGDFTNSIFINTDLSYATFRNIDISGVDLSSSNLNKIISDNITYDLDTLLPTGYIFYNDMILGSNINAAVVNLPDGYGIFDDKLVGPQMIIDSIDLSNEDLQNINLKYSNISGIIYNNNTKLPQGYKIINDNNRLLGPYLEISEIDLSNEDLRNVDFTNTHIQNISSYSNTQLPNGLIIVDGKLVGEGVSLSNVDIKGQDISSWNLYGMRTEGITLGTDIHGNPVKNSTTENVILPPGYVIRKGYLIGPGVDLSYADFRDILSDGTYENNTIDIEDVEFKDIDFSHAKLSKMEIKDVHLENINFTNAHIEDVTFTRITSSNIIPNDGNNVYINNKYSINDGEILGGGKITNKKFIDDDQSYRDYKDREYNNCEFINVTFEGTDLTNTTFTMCVFTNVNMRGTNLTDVQIIESVMDTIYFSTFDKMISQIQFQVVRMNGYIDRVHNRISYNDLDSLVREYFEVAWGYPELDDQTYRYETFIDNLITDDINQFFIDYGGLGGKKYYDIKGKPEYIENENILEFYQPYQKGFVIIKKGRGYAVDTEYRFAASQFIYDQDNPFTYNNYPWDSDRNRITNEIPYANERYENIHIYDGMPFKITRVIPNKTYCSGLTFDNVITKNIRINYNESDGNLSNDIIVIDNMIRANGAKLPSNILGKTIIFSTEINSNNWDTIYSYFTSIEGNKPSDTWSDTLIQEIILSDKSEIKLTDKSEYFNKLVYGIKSGNNTYYIDDEDPIENIDLTEYELKYVNYHNLVTKNLTPEGYVTPEGYKIYYGRLLGQYVKIQENYIRDEDIYDNNYHYANNIIERIYETDTINLLDNYKTKNDSLLTPVNVNYAYLNKYGKEIWGYHHETRRNQKLRSIEILRYFNYKNMIFENISIESIGFKNARFNGSSFKNSLLRYVSFVNCDLSNVDFTNATLINCTMVACSIKGINITNFTTYKLMTRGLFDSPSIDDWANSFDIENIPEIMGIHEFVKDGDSITKNFDNIQLIQGENVEYIVDYGCLFGPGTNIFESVNRYEYNYPNNQTSYDDDLLGTQITLREREKMTNLNAVHYQIIGLGDEDIEFLSGKNILYLPSNGTFIGKYMNIGDIDMSVEFGDSDFANKFRNIDIEGTFLYRINLTRSNKDDDHLYLDRGDGEIFDITNKANTINLSGGRLLSSFMNYKDTGGLRNGNYINIIVENIDFGSSSILNCTFTNCEFRFINFNKADLSDCTFENCNIYRCKFNETTMNNVKFENSNLYKNDTTISDFEFDNIINTVEDTTYNIDNIDIYDDTQQVFIDTTLTNVSFINCDLRHNEFFMGSLKNVEFDNSDLRDSRINSSKMLNIDLSKIKNPDETLTFKNVNINNTINTGIYHKLGNSLITDGSNITGIKVTDVNDLTNLTYTFAVGSTDITLPDGFFFMSGKIIGVGFDLTDTELLNIEQSIKDKNYIIRDIIPKNGDGVILEEGYKLINGNIIGPYIDLSNLNMSSYDLYGMKGTNIVGNNIILPDNYLFISKKTSAYINDVSDNYRIIIGPGIILSDINLDDYDFNINGFGVNYFKGVQSANILPNSYSENYGNISERFGDNFIGLEIFSKKIITEGVTIDGVNISDNTDLSQLLLENTSIKNITAGNLDTITLPPEYVIINGFLLGPGVNLSNQDLSDIDFASSTMMNINLNRSYGINITPENTSSENKYYIKDGYLIGPGLYYNNQEYNNHNFKNLDTSIKPIHFKNSRLIGCDLGGLDLRNCDFSNSDLSYSNLSGCIIDENTIFDNCNLSYTNLQFKDIGNFTFSNLKRFTNKPSDDNVESYNYVPKYNAINLVKFKTGRAGSSVIINSDIENEYQENVEEEEEIENSENTQYDIIKYSDTHNTISISNSKFIYNTELNDKYFMRKILSTTHNKYIKSKSDLTQIEQTQEEHPLSINGSISGLSGVLEGYYDDLIVFDNIQINLNEAYDTLGNTNAYIINKKHDISNIIQNTTENIRYFDYKISNKDRAVFYIYESKSGSNYVTCSLWSSSTIIYTNIYTDDGSILPDIKYGTNILNIPLSSNIVYFTDSDKNEEYIFELNWNLTRQNLSLNTGLFVPVIYLNIPKVVYPLSKYINNLEIELSRVVAGVNTTINIDHINSKLINTDYEDKYINSFEWIIKRADNSVAYIEYNNNLTIPIDSDYDHVDIIYKVISEIGNQTQTYQVNNVGIQYNPLIIIGCSNITDNQDIQIDNNTINLFKITDHINYNIKVMFTIETDSIPIENLTYDMLIIENCQINDFEFESNKKVYNMRVTANNGLCRITIPKDVIQIDQNFKNMETILEFTYDDISPYIEINANVSYGSIESGEEISAKPIILTYSNQDNYQMIDSDINITDNDGNSVDSKYITQLSYDNELNAYSHQFEPFINGTYHISIIKDLYTDSANNSSLSSSFSIVYNPVSPIITLERITPYFTNENPIIFKLISTKRLGYSVDELYRRIKPDNVTIDITNSSVNEDNTQYTIAFIPNINIRQDIEIIIPEYKLVDVTNIPSIDSNFIGWDYFKENLQVTVSSPDIEQYAKISVDIVNLEIKIQDNLQSITYQDSTDYFITNNFDKFDIQTTCAVTEFSYNQTTKIYNIKCIAQLYGSQRVYIPDGVITDKYGNKSLSTEFIWSYDKTVPQITFEIPDVIDQNTGITYDKNLVFKFETFKNNKIIENSDLILFNAVITGIDREIIPRTTRSNININKTDDFTYDVDLKFDENKNTVDELKEIIELENEFSNIDFELIKINNELIGYFKYENIRKFLPYNYDTLLINNKHYVSKEIINKIANTFTTLNRFHVDIQNINSNGLEFNYDFEKHKNKLRVYPFDNNLISDNNFTIDINTIYENEVISIPHIDINKYITIQNGTDYVKITKNSGTSYIIEDQTDNVINTRNLEDGEELAINNIKFLLGSILSDSEPLKAIDIVYVETQFPGESSLTIKEGAIQSETGIKSTEKTIEWIYESYEPIIQISSDTVNNNETHNQDTIQLKLLSSTYTNDFTKQDIYKENGELNNFTHILHVKAANGKFIINDEEAPLLTFKANTKYRFYQSDLSNVNHPIRFSTTSDGTHNNGTQYNLTVFNYGTIGESGAYTDIYITNTQLYYYCANHPGMGNLISISDINSTPSKEYIVDFSVTSIGNCLINIPANQFTDYLTGGTNISSNNLTFTFDNSQTSIVISSDDILPGSITSLSSISLLCTFSKSINNFNEQIFTIQNGTINIVDTSTSGDSFLITFNPDSPGDCSIEIKEGNVTDDIGNTNSSSNIFTFNYNIIKPTITISTNDITDNSISNKNIISFNITPSEKLIGFSQDDIILENGTIEYFNASDTLYTLDFKVIDQGETSISIPENIASDVRGNQNISSNIFNWIYDSIRPSVIITSEQVNSGDISNDNSITMISTFSKEIIDFSLDKFDVTNANLSVISNNLTNDNFVFTFLLIPINQGDITLKLQENKFQDNIGNQNDESNLFTWKYDVESPSIEITSDDIVLNSKTSKSEIVMYLTPSVPSKKFYGTNDNFNIVNGSISNFITIINVEVSNGKFIIDGVSQKSLQFTPNKKYRFDQSDQSNSNNPLRFSETNDGTHTNGGLNYNQNIIVVGVPGTPNSYIDVIITSNITLYYFCSNHPNMGSIISYNINDEEVWNKFQISFKPENPGICSLQVKNNVFENLQGSVNLSSNIFEFNYDNVKSTPVLSSTQINSGDQSNDNFIYLTCKFDKPVSGFSIDGFEITNGGLSIINDPSISSGLPETTYELLFTPTTNGASTIKLKENQFPDSIGNLNNESNLFTWYVYSGDITVSISSNDVQKDALTNKNIINMNIVLSSESDDFTKNSITTKNGNIVFIQNSKTEYVVTFTSLLNGPCSITINTGTFTDTYGNQNSFADYSWNYDNVKPNITISSDDVEHDNQINERKVSLNFTLSESTTTFDIEDIVVENGTLENFSGSGTSYSVDFVATIESACSISVPAESFVDDANNSNLESNTYSWTYYAVTEYDFGNPEVPINETASVKVSVVDIVDGQEIIKTDGRVSAYVQLPGPTEEPKLRTGDGGAKIETTTVTTPDGDIQIISAALSVGFIDEDYGELTASFRYMDPEGNMFYCSEDNNLTLKIGDIVPDPATSSITDTHKLIIDHNYGVANEVVQTLTIKPGWNWISFYVILDDTDLTILQTESDLKDSLIKYNSGAKSFSIHYGEWGWYPTSLTYWEMMNSYQFYYPGTDPITITLTGKNTPINNLVLREGWNWIGFSYTENYEVSEVILTATPGDFIKKKSGSPAFSQYYDGIGWFPGNFEIIPGEGYQYKSIDSKEISLN